MPIPAPHKGESKQTFLGRCSSAIYDEYKHVEGQTIAICETTWKHHKAKASMVVTAGDDEYLVTDAAIDLSGAIEPIRLPSRMHSAAPADPAYPYGTKCPVCEAATMSTERRISPMARETCANGHSYLRGQAIKMTSAAVSEAKVSVPVKSVPSDPINDNGSNRPNSAPPAAPFPAKVAPVSSQPDDEDKEDDDTPKAAPQGGTEDEDNPEYVGGVRVVPRR